MKRFALFLATLLIASAAQARVFNINKETFAAYFNMSAGASSIGTSAFEGAAADDLEYSGDVNYNYTGEFGFVYSRPYVNLKFGFEILKPRSVEDATASNGTDSLYGVDSEMLGYVPKLSVEFNLSRANVHRSFLSFTGGAANINLKNSYRLTSAGQTQFPGVADHDIEAKGQATLLAAGLGYEGLLSDSTTIVVEFGYRQLKFDELSYTKSGAGFSGAHSSGDKVLKASGAATELDFSGGYISIGFRIYL